VCVGYKVEAHLEDETPEERGSALTDAVLAIDQNTGLLNALQTTMIAPLLVGEGQMQHHGIWVDSLAVCFAWGTFLLLLNAVVLAIVHATGLMLAGKQQDKDIYSHNNMIFTGFVSPLATN
jgi:hypothetical protein